MAKLVKLSAPLDTGEEWGLAATHEEVALLRALVGHSNGIGPTGKLYNTFVEQTEFYNREYDVSFSGAVINLTKVK